MMSPRAACLLLAACACAAEAGAQTAPLYSWYSPSRGDNSASTDPRWAGAPGATRSPDYRFVRVEGLVLASARPGTVPLHTWYNPSRGDNFTTTDPRWVGAPGDEQEGYRFVRLEGHVYERPVAGTVPLQSMWDPEREDNHATSSPLSIGDIGATRPPNYRLYRTEGYLIPSPDEPLPDLLLRRLGYAATPVAGERPLLLIQTDFTDVSPLNGASYFEALFFGAGSPSVAGLFRSISGGRFGYRRAGRVTVSFPKTFAEATASVAAFDREVIQRAAAAGADIASFDADGNGTTTPEELAIVVLNPIPGGGSGCAGQTRGVTAAGPGFRYAGNVSFTHEDGEVNMYAHELFHQLEGGEHIYGPGAAINPRASFYAASYCPASSRGPTQLDPWFKIRMGWLRPRVYPILSSAWSAVLAPADPAPTSGREPIVLYDLQRGLDEFFILEYRTPRAPASRGFDAGVNSQGLAVWYVRKDGAHNLVAFNWPPPIRAAFDPSVRTHMLADFIIGSGGPGVGPFWTAADGEFALSWGDGTDSGLRVRVGPAAERSAVLPVQWRNARQPFLPRIDAIRPAAFAAGATPVLAADGVFPVSDADFAVLVEGGGREFRAALATLDVGRVTFTPPSLAAGTWAAVTAIGGAKGNAYPLKVSR